MNERVFYVVRKDEMKDVSPFRNTSYVSQGCEPKLASGLRFHGQRR